VKIGLTAEVWWEVRALFKRVNLVVHDAREGVWAGTYNGHSLRLCLSGMVPSVAHGRVERLLDDFRPDVMISCGLAGALQPHLVVGDLIVQSRRPDLVGIAESALQMAGVPFHVGSLVTVSRPVLSPVDRRALAERTNAIAVDMESQTIAGFCHERAIPCLALKGVSDGIDDDLTPILGGFEIVDIPRIALRVLMRPGTWGLAARLARSSYRSATHLGKGLCAVVSQLPDSIASDGAARPQHKAPDDLVPRGHLGRI
jgi:adenosylhomocysteine nucleosidase